MYTRKGMSAHVCAHARMCTRMGMCTLKHVGVPVCACVCTCTCVCVHLAVNVEREQLLLLGTETGDLGTGLRGRAIF